MDLVFKIGGKPVDVESKDKLNVGISYEVENPDDFQEKGSSTALDIVVPATVNNSKIFNSYHNPNIEDLTFREFHKSLMPCLIAAGGVEILKGYAKLTRGETINDKPENYTAHCFGSNSDWALSFDDKSVYDYVPSATHIFNKAVIEASWNYTGQTALEYVYAPVRYRKAWGGDDTVIRVMDMRPSLSVFYIIQRAFNSIGYTISSDFMNTPYFRRLCLPWVWGDFLNINSKILDELKFRAQGPKVESVGGGPYSTSYTQDGAGFSSTSGNGGAYARNGGFNGQTFNMSNDFELDGFDNSGSYFYDHPSGTMVWQYLPQIAAQLGTITARFTLSVIGSVSAQFNSNVSVIAEIYKEVGGVATLIQNGLLFTASAGWNATVQDFDNQGRVFNFSVSGLNANDRVLVRIRYEWFKSNAGSVNVFLYSGNIVGNTTSYSKFSLTGVEIEPGGIVNFKHYDKFKQYKFLDLLRGVLDDFDIIPHTDSINKVVYLEPAFPYSLDSSSTLNDGHFNSKRLDWSAKEDISVRQNLDLFSDMELEQFFKPAEDGADGGLNKYRLRYNLEPAAAKYLLPNRFRKGKREFRNRFFAPVMHFKAQQWENITGVAPQFIALIPENVANTSNDASESAFQPKLAYYKGLVDRNLYGGWNWDGDKTKNLPFMFAVNYGYNGHNDPVLTYCDQKIGENVGVGLLRRFFLRRMAMYRNGKRLEAYFRLNNNDVTNWRHRELIMRKNAGWHLFGIDTYAPLRNESTKCTLWKYSPITEDDVFACYPSNTSVFTQPPTLSSVDLPYKPMLLLTSDIPK